MKTTQILLVGILSLQGWLLSAGAQLSNNEGSIAAIAAQCAISSGYSASDYLEYSEGLAKTLSFVTAEKQKRVFGYLPQPLSGGLASINSPDAINNTSESTASSSKQVADPGLLVNLVGRFNSAFDGSSPISAPAIEETAASTKAPGSPSPDSAGASTGTSSAAKSEFWSILSAFAKEVDAGYKTGGITGAQKVVVDTLSMIKAAAGGTQSGN